MSSLFPGGPQPFINYNWADIANATGYIVYEAFNAYNSVGDSLQLTENVLIKNTIASNSVSSINSGNTYGTAFAKVLDKDFDTSTFQFNRLINGNVIATIGLLLHQEGAGTGQCYVVVNLYRVRSGTPALIGTQTSAPTQKTGTGDVNAGKTLVFAVSNELIKKGDFLRLNVEVWGKTAASPQYYYTVLKYDPLDTTNTDRTLTIIPYKIEV